MKKEFSFTPADVIFSVGLLFLGLLFWEYRVIQFGYSAIGTFIFIVVAIIFTFLYLTKKGVKQNPKSIIALVILIAGTLPFLLYDPTNIFFFLLCFDLAMFVIWVMYSGKNQVSEKLSGYLFVDTINQCVTTPLCNFDGIFRSIFSSRKNKKSGKTFLFAIVGIIIAIPLLAIVINLLAYADEGFAHFAKKILEILSVKQIFIYFIELVVGIPIAAYIYGSVYGNTHKRFSQILTKENSTGLFEKIHVLPRPALYAPLIAFNLVYILFFIAMATYFFSGFSGDLPSEYTYAAYARKGFFELCAVAAINLFLLMIVYFFGFRKNKEYPTFMRISTCIFSALTVLLILTAISKMIIYIGGYGLTQMRVYVICFLVFILLVFIVLIIWHIRPFNAGKPIVIIGLVLFLTFFLSNHEGLIAKYNIDNYLNGNLKNFDTELFEDMSDAVVPPLMEFRDSLQENDPLIPEVQETIDSLVWGSLQYDSYNEELKLEKRFESWNIQSHIVNKKLSSNK